MNPAAEIFFEDFAVGDVVTYGDREVSREEIITFAREFDPQPFHLDEAAAKASFAGELIASGWHTNCLMHRMTCDAFLNRSSCIGSPGINEVKWLLPVKPGERLTVRRKVLAVTPSASRCDRGVVRFLYDLFGKDGAHLCQHDSLVIFLRREPRDEPAPGSLTARSALKSTEPPEETEQARRDEQIMPYFDDLIVGNARFIGRHEFNDENIGIFAERYDNQWFHIDPVAAAAGPYGGIIASGWHTAAAWMATMVRDRMARSENARNAGVPDPKLGVSPGFRDLRWLKPVRPGDSLRYFVRPIEKRASASRPGWGIVNNESWALNQRHEKVFSFFNSVFWERRRP